MKLSVFQLLKQGSSFKNNKKTQENNEIPKEHESDEESSMSEKIKEKQNEIQTCKKKKEIQLKKLEMQKLLNIKKDKNNKLKKKYRIHIENEDEIFLIKSFDKIQKKFNIEQQLIKNLKSQGYKKLTPVQMACIPLFFQNKNLLIIAPTGSGKTLSYIMPLLTIIKQKQKNEKQGIKAIVLSPSLELSEQIYREFVLINNKNFNSLKIQLISNLNSNHKTLNEQQKYIDILVSTPLTLLKQIKLGIYDLSYLKYFIMDEADKYFELGFTKQINQIIEHLKDKENLKYQLFSATVSNDIEQMCNQDIQFTKVLIGGKNNVLSKIKQKLVYVGTEFGIIFNYMCIIQKGKIVEIRNIINRGEFSPPVLIFVQSKERAEELLIEFRQQTHIKIESIHSDKPQNVRLQICEDFRLGKIWALICTDLFARGIDFKNIQLVINYDFPNSMINYIHRVGRTGRAEKDGKSVTFYTDLDKPLLKSLGNMLNASGCEVPEWIFQLKNTDKQILKKLQKFPVKREHISQEMGANADKRFQIEMKIRDKKFKKLQQENKDEDVFESDEVIEPQDDSVEVIEPQIKKKIK